MLPGATRLRNKNVVEVCVVRGEHNVIHCYSNPIMGSYDTINHLCKIAKQSYA